jgi:tRNA-splicing ligase RtcB
MSRSQATRQFTANDVVEMLRKRGVYIRAASKDGIVEEAPGAYKDVDDVVGVAHGAGISRIVAKLRPMGVMKG